MSKNPHYEALGFYHIIEKLKELALSEQAKAVLDRLEPFMKEEQCISKMKETTAARKVLDTCGTPPLVSMNGMEEALKQAEIGAMLTTGQLVTVSKFAASCGRMAKYLQRGEILDQAMGAYGRSIGDLSELQSEIDHSVQEERVYDDASPALRNLRRKQEHVEGQIKEKLNHVLKSRSKYLAEQCIVSRNGRFVLPVQRRYQSQFGGTVIEVSGKGSTVFMEPSSVSKLQSELAELSIEEDNEVRRILYTLTAMVSEQEPVIRRNMEAMEILDVLFAKGALSAAMGARPVEIGCERRLDIRQGRHPLLDPATCVPLDLKMEESLTGIIITGPNTGGKTVAIKTAGLLSLMAQCGLHIPCEEGSYIAMQDGYWCDIGDSQNISQNLSTFSGHITNVIRILESASPDSLVILDELGSGTDPAEGMGIAVAVLDELRLRKCMFLVTTHYPQVKSYARQKENVIGARMAFDRDSLQPLYRLELGKSGESCALDIAKRLGLASHLLDRAYYEVYGHRSEDFASECGSMAAPKSRLVRKRDPKKATDVRSKFKMGDSVLVLPEKEIGIVYKPADENGDVTVQVKGKKRKVKHNRLQLKVAAEALYPPDYDFSIIFDSVENRKARHQLDRGSRDEAVIEYEE